MFSVFSSVYDFVRLEPQDAIQAVPEQVRTELAVAAFLMPLLGADLGREFLPLLTACDAAPAFGCGVSFLRCSAALVEKVGSLAEKRGDFVRFFPDPADPVPPDRLGNPHKLPVSKSDFRVAIAAKARWQAHSGILEAHGLLLAVKRLLRTQKHFHRRLVVLIDAKAVLGAATKGRTSAPCIRGVLRRLGATLLAANCLLRLVYVPSEENPADAPSRGVKKSTGKRKRDAVRV